MMKKIIPLLLGLVSLDGCTTSQPDSSQLIKRQFILSAVDGKAMQLHSGIRLSINFGPGMKINGVMCNSFFGQGRLKNGQLSVLQLASTRMLCSNTELNEWEKVISQMLRQGARVSLNQKTLILSGSGHVLQYQML